MVQILTDVPAACKTTDSDGAIIEIEEFLESHKPNLDDYLLSPQTLNRFGNILDIVTPSSKKSCCFTKAYGHYVEGTGSVLQTAQVDVSCIKLHQNRRFCIEL
jgi:hypothetical protein